MNSHPLVQYKAEKGLHEVLCTLEGQRRPVEEMATRIKLAMDKVQVKLICLFYLTTCSFYEVMIKHNIHAITIRHYIYLSIFHCAVVNFCVMLTMYVSERSYP